MGRNNIFEIKKFNSTYVNICAIMTIRYAI